METETGAGIHPNYHFYWQINGNAPEFQHFRVVCLRHLGSDRGLKSTESVDHQKPYLRSNCDVSGPKSNEKKPRQNLLAGEVGRFMPTPGE
ncbi:hypothetical protein [Phaeobacter sp. J2-8]|uniref:hypothetical protein n=1 Tax=Phaeobacter sp. J2-8 TaxID=2931394 RepID=UPI001FD0A82F|nr:hypothetical protein [Phaeobacter sp. J2-8]MCJ7870921.1 hypothetical protein [Phaeobacter sp. J2-8]